MLRHGGSRLFYLIGRELNIGNNECGEIFKTIKCGKSKKQT